MKKQICTSLTTAALLVTLTGCGDLFKKESTSSMASDIPGAHEPLVQFGSKTVLTVGDFDAKLKGLMKAQQEMEFVLASMPEADQMRVYEQFADHCVNEQLVKEYIKKKGIDQTTEYKDIHRQAHEAIDTSLNMQAFQNDVYKEAVALVDKMGETELRAFYEANREKDQNFQKPPFLKAGAKKEYAKFEDVRDAVAAVAKQLKAMEMIQERMDGLKKDQGVTVKKECLARFVKKSPQQPMMPEEAPAAPAAPGSVANGSAPAKAGTETRPQAA